jgi:hypothetical protein
MSTDYKENRNNMRQSIQTSIASEPERESAVKNYKYATNHEYAS